MAQYAELHDGRRLEFPDGTDPSVIQAVVKRTLAGTAETQKGPQEGVGQAALIGAGRGADKVVQGVRQLYNFATGDQATLDQMKADETEKDRLFAPLKDAHPYATAIGEAAPLIAMPGGAGVKGAMAIGALPGLLGYGTASERLARGAAGAVGNGVGNLAGQAIGRFLKPAGSGVAGVSDDALQAAERVGFKPTAGQITQNPGMQNFENYLLRSPGSSGAMQAVKQGQQTSLNTAAARSMGETADNLGEGVFASAKNRIGGEFDRLSQVTKPDLTGGFLNTLAKIDADNGARGAFASGEIKGLVDKALDLASKNNLDGKAYKEIRSEMASRAQAAFRAGDATTGQAYKTLYTSLDDAAKASLSKADQQAWDVARKEWGAFKTLSKSNVAEAGDVSAARAAAAVRSAGPQLRTGQATGDLADIARVGEAFKSVPNPNSGNLMNQMMFSNPLSGLPMLAGNRAAAGVYMNPLVQRYLAKGILDIGPTGQGILSRAGGQLGVPASYGLLGVE